MFGVPAEAQARLTPAEKEWASEFLRTMHPISLRKAGIYNDREYNIHDYPIERITVPTLVIHAGDDSLVPFAQGQYTAQNIPGARLIKQQSGGHFLMGEHEKVRSEVEEFLKQHTRADAEK